MTQKDCALLHGVSKPAVQQIWSGFRRPKGYREGIVVDDMVGVTEDTPDNRNGIA